MKKVQFSDWALAIFNTVFNGDNDDTFVRLSDLRETFSEILESDFEAAIEEMIKSGFARLLLTCTMPNKAPALIRPIIMKYAERKTTTT